MTNMLQPTDTHRQLFPAAHAAEPTATAGDALRRRSGRKRGMQTAEQPTRVLPPSMHRGITRMSVDSRCRSVTATTLADERGAAREGAGGASLQARRRSDLAWAGALDKSFGRSTFHGGRRIRP